MFLGREKLPSQTPSPSASRLCRLRRHIGLLLSPVPIVTVLRNDHWFQSGCLEIIDVNITLINYYYYLVESTRKGLTRAKQARGRRNLSWAEGRHFGRAVRALKKIGVITRDVVSVSRPVFEMSRSCP